MPSKEVELSPEQALERAQEAVDSPILRQLDIRIGNPEDAGIRIAMALAEAGTIDDLLAEGSASGWEAQEGRSFLIRSAEYAPSTQPGGLGFFAIVTVVDADTGEQLVLTTGATNPVIQVAKMLSKGWTDVPVKLVVSKAASGNTVHRLVKGEAGDSVPFD